METVQIEVRYMAGDCRTGNGRRRIKWHAVPACDTSVYPILDKSVCGRRPSIQWSDARPGQAVTCPACLKRLGAVAAVSS